MKYSFRPEKCKWCSARLNEIVPPEIPHNPNLILVGEAPGRVEREQGKPFVGESGQLLRSIVRDKGARPIYVNSVIPWQESKPTTEAIKIERETHLIPLLEAYPGVPVVALGRYAAMALLGGQQSESKKAGEVLWLYDRPVLFTFHPAYQLYKEHDPRITEHIALHIEAALRPLVKPTYFLDRFTKFLSNDKFMQEVIIDVETDSEDYPQYSSGIVVLGVYPLGGIPHVFSDEFLRRGDNLKKLQAMLKGKRKIIGHSLGFDIAHAEYRGFDFSEAEFHDTFIFLKNLGVDELSFGLKFMAKRLGFPPYEAKFHAVLREMGDVSKKKDQAKKAEAMKMIRNMPLADLADYNAQDLYATSALYEQQINESPKPPGLFELDMDYMHYITRMVRNGLYVSKKKLNDKGAMLDRDKERLESRARRSYHLGKDFNFNSPKQIRSMLTQLALDLPDTNKQTLLDHFEDHPFIPELLDIRKINKAVGKVKEIKSRLTKENLLHSKISVHGTETARLSSKEPNIENFDVLMKDVIGSRY